MSKHVLKLNADFSPLALVPWEDAIELILADKATVVESVPGKFVRSEKLVMAMPSVVALRRYKVVKGRIRFSGKNVILRDRGVCAYCGCAPKDRQGFIDRTELTMDHVIPRATGKQDHNVVYTPWLKTWTNVTSWTNCVTACRACNSAKKDRSPEQAGMPLRFFPRTLTHNDVMRMLISRVRDIPAEWLPYLPDHMTNMSETATCNDSISAAQIIKFG